MQRKTCSFTVLYFSEINQKQIQGKIRGDEIMKMAPFFALALALLVTDVAAQGTPSDQYKQMGGVAGLAETCYGSTKIRDKLAGLVDAAVKNDPSIKGMMDQLVKSYNDAYYKATKDKVMWIGTTQQYNRKPYSCQVQEDVNVIRGMEQTVLVNMR
jgi:hypothetical protein